MRSPPPFHSCLDVALLGYSGTSYIYGSYTMRKYKGMLQEGIEEAKKVTDMQLNYIIQKKTLLPYLHDQFGRK